MAIKLKSGRQEPLYAEVPFTYADFVSGTIQKAAELPVGASVIGGDLVIDEAFNSGTSDTLTVGDTGNNSRYANAINGQSAARTALVPTGYVTTAVDSGSVGVKWTGVGAAPTAGKGRLRVQYVVAGRAATSQGLDFRGAGIPGA